MLLRVLILEGIVREERLAEAEIGIIQVREENVLVDLLRDGLWRYLAGGRQQFGHLAAADRLVRLRVLDQVLEGRYVIRFLQPGVRRRSGCRDSSSTLDQRRLDSALDA